MGKTKAKWLHIDGNFFNTGSTTLLALKSGSVLPITASHVLNGGIGSSPGTLSSSAQIATEISGAFVETSASLAADITAVSNSLATLDVTSVSFASTASYVEYNNVVNKPTLISGSYQISSDISGSFVEASSSIAIDINNLQSFSSSLDNVYISSSGQNVVLGEVSASSLRLSDSGSDAYIYYDGTNRGIRYNATSSAWQLSNNGEFYSDIQIKGGAGALEKPVITNNGDGTIDVSSINVILYSSASWQGSIAEYVIPAATNLAVPEYQNSILAVTYNNENPEYYVTTTPTEITDSDVVEVVTMYRHEFDIHYVENSWGLGTPSRLNRRLVDTQRFVRTSGLALGESGSRVITIGSGNLWWGIDQFEEQATSSINNNAEFWYHSASVWTSNLTSSYNNEFYDDGTDLVALGNNRYVNNWVYRFINSPEVEQIAYIVGTEWPNLAQAQAATIPEDIPDVFDSQTILVGRILVQKGASSATQIDSAFSSVLAGSSATDHNSLANLQGGTTSQYYHLTAAEHSSIILDSDTGSMLSNNVYISSSGQNVVLGNITADVINATEIHTTYQSASVLYSSGSTKFGDTTDDTHEFTGSLKVTGSVTATSFVGDGSGLTGVSVAGTISSSAQIASDISGSFTDLSSSVETRISTLETEDTDLDSRLDSLQAATSSYALSSNVSGSFVAASSSIAADINALQSFSGSLDNIYISASGQNVVLGNIDAQTITAQEMHISEVTSSVLYQSGSTKFGDSADDTHQITGSLLVNGDAEVSGTLNISEELQLPNNKWIAWDTTTETNKRFLNLSDTDNFSIGAFSSAVYETLNFRLGQSATEAKFNSTEFEFNTSNLDRDFFINKSGSGIAYNYDAGTDTHTFSGSVDFINNVTFNQITGSSALIDGDLVVTGKVTAEEFHTEFISSSILYKSGSTKFGDTSDDTHEFTGSVSIRSGSFLFNSGNEDFDFTINKSGSAEAYKYDAGLDTHTFGGEVTFLDPITGSSAVFNGDLHVIGSINGTYSYISISQSNHGFSQLDAIYYNTTSSLWKPAIANDPTTLGIGIVSNVVDSGSFQAVFNGQVNVSSHGLNLGEYYYVSTTDTGSLTDVKPFAENLFENPIVYVIDADTILVLPWRPSVSLPRNSTYVSPNTITTSSYDCSIYDEFLRVDATSNDITINLLPASSSYSGYETSIKRLDNTANNIFIKCASGSIDETIGTTGTTINGEYTSATFVCDGQNYWVK